MAKDVALLAVHGMGKTPTDFANELEEELLSELGSADWGRVHFKPIYYQGLLQKKQEKVFTTMKNRAELDWLTLRRFLLFGFSDAAGLEYRAAVPNSLYEQAQRIILDVLNEAYDKLGQTPKPVIIICQSLGGHVLSNYIWDSQLANATQGIWSNGRQWGAPRGSDKDNFRRLKTLRYLYTTGCNIPIFVSGLGRDKIKAIKTTTSGYDIRWFNYYDEDDPLGWPLKPLSTPYGRAVRRDIAVNAGGSFFGHITHSWNPLSHTRYWRDKKIIRPLARHLKGLL